MFVLYYENLVTIVLHTFFYSYREEEGDRGVPHRWQGYSCTVKPARIFLSQPVLQAALGTRHGVLLTKGIYHSYLLRF